MKVRVRAGVRVGTDRQLGVSVLEVLISLVVISVGVAVAVGLQINSIKKSSESYYQATAMMLAEDMANRMRINHDAVVQGRYADFDSRTNPDYCTTRPVPYCQTTAERRAQRCGPRSLTRFDQFSVACGDWGSDGATGGVHGLLPEGASLRIECDEPPCGPESVYSIIVSWSASGQASSRGAYALRTVQMRLRP